MCWVNCPAKRKSGFEAQCESDPLLAAAVDEARGVTGQLQNLYASESTPPLDPERRDAIVSNEIGSVTLPNIESSWRVPALVLAAAAVLLLLVGLAPWLRQQDKTVAMDDNELKQQTTADRVRVTRNITPSRSNWNHRRKRWRRPIESVAVAADDSSDADQIHEFAIECARRSRCDARDCVGGAVPSLASVDPDRQSPTRAVTGCW